MVVTAVVVTAAAAAAVMQRGGWWGGRKGGTGNIDGICRNDPNDGSIWIARSICQRGFLSFFSDFILSYIYILFACFSLSLSLSLSLSFYIFVCAHVHLVPVAMAFRWGSEVLTVSLSVFLLSTFCVSEKKAADWNWCEHMQRFDWNVAPLERLSKWREGQHKWIKGTNSKLLSSFPKQKQKEINVLNPIEFTVSW